MRMSATPVRQTPVHTPAPRWIFPFAATLFAMFTLQLSNLGFSPLLPSIRQEFGLNYTQLGLFTGIYGLLAIALSVPAGLGAKWFGEKWVLGSGLLGVAVGSVLLGEAWNFESAIAFRGLTIFGYRFAFVSVLVAVALTAPLSLRGRTMGIVGATSALASVVGAPLGGLLVDDFTWRVAILGYAGMAVLGALVFWTFYRPTRTDASRATPAGGGHGAIDEGDDAHAIGGRSAFRSPVVWMLALIVGLGGFGQFTVTYFVPSVTESLFGLDAAAAGWIISTGYMTAIVVNLIVGVLADRFNKLAVLGGVFAILVVASSSMTIEHLPTFRIATAAVLGFGFTAANQLYGLAGVVMPRREAANAMGVVSLGAGLFGYFGPQMLGFLRDRTGTWAAGFYMVAIADLITLGLLLLLYRMTRARGTAGVSGSIASGVRA
jgi:predicted MFS family arabinose efflux permease